MGAAGDSAELLLHLLFLQPGLKFAWCFRRTLRPHRLLV